MRYIRLFFLFLFFAGPLANAVDASAQESRKYRIYFTDKGDEKLDISAFSPQAVERRIRNNTWFDDTDVPVERDYITVIKELADTMYWSSAWFNCVTSRLSKDAISLVRKLSFVKSVEEISESAGSLATATVAKDLKEDEKLILAGQIQSLQGHKFREAGITGKGITIAVFDAGFPGVNTNPLFSHLFERGAVKKTFDFVAGKENVYGAGVHGTMVLSCIAGKQGDSIIMGMATGADFLLARTERMHSEPFSEEENWLAAVEWADKNGADIINSSLGYTYHRYFPEQMDGTTSLVSRAANLAASKGILVVNAAGNDGAGKWKYLGTPADADSVLTIGGVDPETKIHTAFSSYGPTADKRMKPNLCAYGHVICAQKEGMDKSQGTSFATPLVAGFAACAMEIKKDIKVMDFFREMERAGSLYPYFDYAHGFGLPQATYFLNKGMKDIEPTFDLERANHFTRVKIKSEFFTPFSADTTDPDFFYYHIQNSTGILEKYFVLRVDQPEILVLYNQDFAPGDVVRVHYKGYTQTITY